MKKSTTRGVSLLVLMLFCLTNYSTLFSQSILARLDGTQTNFDITSDHSSLLNNSRQYIGRRAINQEVMDEEGIRSCGHEVFHLEFLATNKLVVHEAPPQKDSKYRLSFFDEEDELLVAIDFDSKLIRQMKLNKNRLIYSINLKNVPLVLLNETQRIDIIFFNKRS